MAIHVLLFASLKDVIGQDQITLDLESPASVSQLLDRLEQQYPKIHAYRSILRVAVNQEYGQPDTLIQQGDEIALIPPVSGG